MISIPNLYKKFVDASDCSAGQQVVNFLNESKENGTAKYRKIDLNFNTIVEPSGNIRTIAHLIYIKL